MSKHNRDNRPFAEDWFGAETSYVTLDAGVVLIRPSTARSSSSGGVADHHEHRLGHLIDKLPARLRTGTHWLRRPTSRWARMPVGALLVAGGMLSILPFLGIWMLPLGLVLLADDVPMLWRARGRVLDWIAQRRPHWFADRAPSPGASATA